MKEQTRQYLLALQLKINYQEEIHIETNEEFNKGYLAGRKVTINDVVSAVKKLEGE